LPKRKSWWQKNVKIGDKSRTAEQFLYDSWKILSDAEIADALSNAIGKEIPSERVRDKRRRCGLRKTQVGGAPIIFDDSETTVYNNPPVVKSDNVLVMADMHVPYHDSEWCSYVVHEAKRANIEECIIAGDLFDFSALSSFAKFITVNGDDEDITQEIGSAASFVSVLLDNFERVLFTLGNHEKRLSRSVGVRVRVNLIKALLGKSFEERLKIEPYYYSIIESSTGKWRITHPKNSSVIPIRVAARMADKYRMHVVAGHGHDWGCATSVSGFYAAACGACCDIARLDYVQLEDNLRPIMQNGAFMLRDGKPLLLHPRYG